MSAFGRSLGLSSRRNPFQPREPPDARLYDKTILSRVEDAMYTCVYIFGNQRPSAVRRVFKRYGLMEVTEQGEPVQRPGFFERLTTRPNRLPPGEIGFTDEYFWTICDEQKFLKLVSKIRGLNDRLQAAIAAQSHPDDLTIAFREELSGVEDVHHLEMLQQVADEHSLMFHVVRGRLAELSYVQTAAAPAQGS